jgi:hypothetical protein
MPVSRGRKGKPKSKSKAKKHHRAPGRPSVADVMPESLVSGAGPSPFQRLMAGMGPDRPAWFDRSIKALLDQAGILMTARGPRELEQATAELIGAELHRAVRDEDHGLRFDWLVEELAEAAADSIQDETAREQDSRQAQWRLLYGLTSIGSPALRLLVEDALTQLRKELPASAQAEQPEWLRLLPKIAATGEVWEMHDMYGSRFAVIAGFRYPGGTDPSMFLFDIDACEMVMLAGAGVFDDVQQAAAAWRARAGEAAAGAEPSPVETAERLSCLAYLELGGEFVVGTEPRAVMDNWLRANRRHMDLAEALRRRGMPLPETKSLYHDLDIAPMVAEFTAWHLRRHGSTPDPEAAELLAEVWLEGALPSTRHSISPHRVRSRLEQINEDFIDDPVTTAAKALLPEWVWWNSEKSGLPGVLVDRSVAAASGEPPPSAGGGREQLPSTECPDTTPVRRTPQTRAVGDLEL